MKLYTVKEVAELLGQKQQTVLDHINKGWLNASNIAKEGSKRPRYKITEKALEDFLERRSVKHQAKRGTRKRLTATRKYY